MIDAAVIVNFNSSNYVAALLRDLADSELNLVLVVDNASEIGERRALACAAQNYQNVSVLNLPENLGFGAAVNLAVRRLTSAVRILVINPDCRTEPASVNTLLSRIEPGTLLAPMVLAGDGISIWCAGGSVDLAAGRAVHEGIGTVWGGAVARYPVQFVSGAVLAFDRNSWFTFGEFMEELFLYWEDVELCLRWRRQGGSVVVDSSSVFRHWEGGSSRGDSHGRSEVFYFYYCRNRELLYAPNSRPTWAWVAESARIIGRALLRERSRRLAKVRAACRGVIEGRRLRRLRSRRPSSSH